ncbi:response regulator transcription factor [Halalkalibacterium ligniniphilum]|uniref:response regulator transcription factor n=1 Tax=Halalkalibacterium ligniniphilum TaxID=1134413 RepID=UPI00034D2413|nr:response regulator transcription factor [Halalkalibacterium ligniniphilum]
MKRILIVDDEIQMQRLIAVCIQSNDFSIESVSSGKEALEKVKKTPYDLMLLDVMMPEMNGFQVLEELRTFNHSLPVIVLTALGDTDDVVKGLNSGADDYITKPFEPKELVARVQAVLRRFQQVEEPLSKKQIFGLSIDDEKKQISFKETPLILTKKEYQLLSRLILHPGQVYTREELLSLEWDHADERFDRNIDTHIKNIREKLKKVGVEKNIIETVWGIGYKLMEPGEHEQ